MSVVRIAAVGCALLLMGALSGCGDGSNTGAGAPPAEDRPDAGLEASKRIMQMQPPGPAGKKKGDRR